jgi:hypothetical protein
MKPTKLFSQLTKITLIGSTFFLISSLNQASFAQVTNNQNSDGYQQNEQDSFGGQGGFNPFNLIHNANLGISRSMGEFKQETEQNLNDAAAEFKRLQIERIRQQRSQNSTNVTPKETPESTVEPNQ